MRIDYFLLELGAVRFSMERHSFKPEEQRVPMDEEEDLESEQRIFE